MKQKWTGKICTRQQERVGFCLSLAFVYVIANGHQINQPPSVCQNQSETACGLTQTVHTLRMLAVALSCLLHVICYFCLGILAEAKVLTLVCLIPFTFQLFLKPLPSVFKLAHVNRIWVSLSKTKKKDQEKQKQRKHFPFLCWVVSVLSPVRFMLFILLVRQFSFSNSCLELCSICISCTFFCFFPAPFFFMCSIVYVREWLTRTIWVSTCFV